MNYSRAVSTILIVVGAALLVACLVSNALGRETAAFAISMIFWSVLAYLAPRSNDDWVRGAVSVLHFSVLSFATFASIALAAYLLFGAPEVLSDEMLTVVLAFGLPAALVVPLIARQVTQSGSTKGQFPSRPD